MATRELFGLDGLSVPISLEEAVEHGEVFTRRWVVDLILDLVGYTADLDLAEMVIIEPACGGGAFLGPIVERLSKSCRDRGRDLTDARNAVRALDLLDRNVSKSRKLVEQTLIAQGWDGSISREVAEAWVNQGDYLLHKRSAEEANFVVGNPPYIRLEDVPDERMNLYRLACETMGGRSDIYVGFFEVALKSLKPRGRLGFICADRWMRNQYGSRIRQFISRDYSVDLTLSMHDVDAFDERVSAYPAITIISNTPQGAAVAAEASSSFDESDAANLHNWVMSDDKPTLNTQSCQAARLTHWFTGDDMWPAASPARIALLEDLAERFDTLESRETGTKVGIGVATGADKVFICEQAEKPTVEADRLLPLAMVRDTTTGQLKWTGCHLVNPWDASGNLVELSKYPLLARYFNRHASTLRARYVATKQPDRWFKTIDKVDHKLAARSKLLFPDMKTTIHPVLDDQGLYPHHNLYYVVSDTWDMQVLGGLLLSKIAEAFVSAYGVRMRGGTLRFQAQYLRKIRVPDPAGLSDEVKSALVDAFARRDVEAATDAALRAYDLKSFPD